MKNNGVEEGVCCVVGFEGWHFVCTWFCGLGERLREGFLGFVYCLDSSEGFWVWETVGFGRVLDGSW